MKRLVLTFSLVFISISFLAQPNKTTPTPTSKKVNVEFEFSEKQSESAFDKYFGYFTDLAGPIIALLGIFLALPILRKKLVENHITTSLNQIQSANLEIQINNQELIDKYIPLTFKNDILSEEQLNDIYREIENGYHLSQKGSSDVTTLTFYLKFTLQRILKNYHPDQSILTTRDLLGWLIGNLELIKFFSTQVVSIPKSTETKKFNLIKPPLRKYVTYAYINQYKYFKRGVIEDPNSAHFIIFCQHAIRSNNPLFMRSAFQIYNNPCAIGKILLSLKLYAPLILDKPNNDPIWGIEKLTLYLVGFSISKHISVDPKAPKDIIDLYYSNTSDFYLFVSNLDVEKLKTKFCDNWISNSEFDLNNIYEFNNKDFETIAIRYDINYLKEQFEKNKRKFKSNLKPKS